MSVLAANSDVQQIIHALEEVRIDSSRDVFEDLCNLEAMLEDEGQIRHFNDLSLDEMQDYLFMLMGSWEAHQESEYVQLFMHCLPYYVEHLEGKIGNNLFEGITSTKLVESDSFSDTLCECMQARLGHKKAEKVAVSQELDNLKKIFECRAFTFLDTDPATIFAKSLLEWKRCSAPTIFDFLSVMQRLANWIPKRGNEIDGFYRTCQELLCISNDSNFIYNLITYLKKPFEGPLKQLYINTVMHKTFSPIKRNELIMQHMLKKEYNLVLVIKDSFRISLISRLLTALEKSDDAALQTNTLLALLAAKWEPLDAEMPYKSQIDRIIVLASKLDAHKFSLLQKVEEKIAILHSEKCRYMRNLKNV